VRDRKEEQGRTEEGEERRRKLISKRESDLSLLFHSDPAQKK
jgi:hypothetical protein